MMKFSLKIFISIMELLKLLTTLFKRIKSFIVTNKPTITCQKFFNISRLSNKFKSVIGIDYKIIAKEKDAKAFEDKASALDYFFSNNNYHKKKAYMLEILLVIKKLREKLM